MTGSGERNGVLDRLRGAFPDAVVADGGDCADPWVQVRPESVRDAIRFLRDADDLAFDFLMCITGMDLSGLQEAPDLRVVYHLYSYRHRQAITVRADVPRESPVVPSIVGLYPIANWHEREAFDLLGLRFDGHPDLTRILLPPEWEGHPLRRDWKEGPTCLGFPTGREDRLSRMRAEAKSGEGT